MLGYFYAFSSLSDAVAFPTKIREEAWPLILSLFLGTLHVF